MKTPSRLLSLFTLLSVAAHANGVVHIPEPSGGWSYPTNGWYHPSSASVFDQGITFGDDMAIVPTIDGISFVRRDPSSYQFFEFVSSEVMISDPNSGGWVSLTVPSSMVLHVNEAIQTSYIILKDSQFPRLDLGDGISFGDGITDYPDTSLSRLSVGTLQINGQTIVTQNALANYVTLSGVQTLTNKIIDAGQLTGSVTVAKGGTGATSLTGILKGNGTSAVTAVTAPSGALVGTTDTQILSNKTLLNPTITGTLSGGANGLTLNSDTAVVGSFTAGEDNIASGYMSAAFGEETVASMPNAVAFGYYAQANGEVSFAAGYGAQAMGVISFAIGDKTVAKAYNSVAMGQMNVEQGNANAWVATDDLVTVGNGDAYAAGGPVASNALALHKNGNLRVAGVVNAKAGIRTAPMGDIGMGDFTAGADPATMNAGLRFPTE